MFTLNPVMPYSFLPSPGSSPLRQELVVLKGQKCPERQVRVLLAPAAEPVVGVEVVELGEDMPPRVGIHEIHLLSLVLRYARVPMATI